MDHLHWFIIIRSHIFFPVPNIINLRIAPGVYRNVIAVASAITSAIKEFSDDTFPANVSLR